MGFLVIHSRRAHDVTAVAGVCYSLFAARPSFFRGEERREGGQDTLFVVVGRLPADEECKEDHPGERDVLESISYDNKNTNECFAQMNGKEQQRLTNE
jgi:hypothetical protein